MTLLYFFANVLLAGATSDEFLDFGETFQKAQLYNDFGACLHET